MGFLGCIGGRRIRLAAAHPMLLGAFLTGAEGPARGDAAPAQPASLVSGPGAVDGAVSSPGASGGGTSGAPAAPPRDSAEVKYNGTPTPGARITVGLDGPEDPAASYQWVQIDGPPVIIDGETQPKIRFTIPPDAAKPRFSDDQEGSRGASEPPGSPSRSSRRPGRTPSATLRADGGDDQIGLVGRRITLNGSRSIPRTGVVYRWLQLAGPKLEQPVQENSYYSFIPTASGVYRFGLVVASATATGEVSISELDDVLVTVGELPTGFGCGPTGAITNSVPTAALDQMLQGPGSIAARATLDQVAGVFEAVAARASLYTSFADLSSEMMRRLDSVIPADPSWRQFWTQGVFTPLTQHVVTEMLAAGLDLRVPQGQLQRLDPPQQDKLQKLFTYYARECRSRTDAR